jgi:hypothetical protein
MIMNISIIKNGYFIHESINHSEKEEMKIETNEITKRFIKNLVRFRYSSFLLIYYRLVISNSS